MNVYGRGPQGEKGETGPPGEKGDRGESVLVIAAEEQVARLIQAKTIPRWWGMALTGVAIILLAGSAFLGAVAYQTYHLTHTVQEGAIAQCEDANHVRADDIEIWDTFVSLAEGTKPTPGVIAEAKAFEKFIAKVESPTNCAAVYGN